jgi:outer membrane lipoprotein LolB
VKIAHIILPLIILTGCAATTPKVSENHYLSWQARQKQLTNLKNWTLQSAVGITNSTQHIAARVYWQQFDHNYAINITSLFNLGGIKIIGDSTHVILQRSITDKVIAKTPEKLMYRELGWSLPISNLRYWILGLPAPKLPYISNFDSYNRLIHLKQQNWQIDYADFISVDAVDLPTTILLSNTKLQIKIIIKKWGGRRTSPH